MVSPAVFVVFAVVAVTCHPFFFTVICHPSVVAVVCHPSIITVAVTCPPRKNVRYSQRCRRPPPPAGRAIPLSSPSPVNRPPTPSSAHHPAVICLSRHHHRHPSTGHPRRPPSAPTQQYLRYSRHSPHPPRLSLHVKFRVKYLQVKLITRT